MKPQANHLAGGEWPILVVSGEGPINHIIPWSTTLEHLLSSRNPNKRWCFEHMVLPSNKGLFLADSLLIYAAIAVSNGFFQDACGPSAWVIEDLDLTHRLLV
jgi:hypothetical protein